MSTYASTSPLRRRAALAVAALTVTTLGASVVEADVAAAAGKKAKVNASISLTRDKSQLVGAVKSPKKACKQKKTVVLHWLQPGKKKFVEVADDKSSSKGVWKIHAPGTEIPAGKYYVTIKAGKSCQTGRSKRITVR
ncbi:hypothetical protein BH09ACT12_BH09ACT12_36740 [soil metagenome]